MKLKIVTVNDVIIAIEPTTTEFTNVPAPIWKRKMLEKKNHVNYFLKKKNLKWT